MTGTTISNLYSSGYTMSAISTTLSSNILVITDSNSKDILKITCDNEIFYRFNDDMVKVNCSEDIIEAFKYSVLNLTNKDIDEVLIDKYMKSILNNDHSNEYINKIEKFFRNEKLKKINTK